MSKIIIRRRFPNFVCDGRPLGPEEHLYIHELNSTEEFFEIDWVKEKQQNGCTGWSKTVPVRDDVRPFIMGTYDDGKFYAFAWLVEGDLNLPEFIEDKEDE